MNNYPGDLKPDEGVKTEGEGVPKSIALERVRSPRDLELEVWMLAKEKGNIA